MPSARNELDAPALPPWLRRMVPWDRYALNVGDQRMVIMDGRPPQAPDAVDATVLMVHGNPTWGFLYRRVVDALRGAPLRVVLPDLIGLGWSSKPAAAAHSLDRHIEWLHEALEALDLDRVIFVGQDWGGPIGLGALARYADAHPGRVVGLVLLNTVVGPPSDSFSPTAFHRLSQLPVVSDVLFRGLGFVQRAMPLAQGDRRSIRGKVARAYRLPLRGRRNDAAPLAMARMVPDSLTHPSIPALEAVRDYVSAFDGPAGIVWGRRDPILGRVHRRVRRTLSAAEIVYDRSTDAGHFLQEEVPGPIAAAIRAVLAAR